MINLIKYIIIAIIAFITCLSVIGITNAVPPRVLTIPQGGTGISTVPTDGQLLIGKTNGLYNVSTLTEGSNITITNADGSITIASTGGAGAGGALGWAYDSDSTLLTRSTTTDQTLIGGTATTSDTAMLEVIGASELDNVNMLGASSTSLYINGDLNVVGDMGILDADVPNDITIDLATEATNLADYSSVYNWSGINTFSSDLRVTGTLHASTTDFDLLQVNGNATTTGSHYIAGTASTTELFVQEDGHIGGGLSVDGNVTTSQAFYGDYWISATGNSMNVQPTGDMDDYFSFKTPAHRPTMKVEGGDRIYVESSDSDEVGIEYRKDASHSGAIIYYKNEELFGLTSQDSMVFKVCGDYDDYVKICSANNTPELSVASSSAFKINAGDTNPLLLNDAGGNVGIGLTSPTSTLAVLGDTVLTGNATTTGWMYIGQDLTVNGTINGNVTGALTGNASTATALAADGANCAAGSYPLGVDASGAVQSCTDATTEIDSAIATHLTVIADTSTTGHLNDTDWDTFNNKWDGLTDMVLTDNYIYVGDASNDPVGVAMSGDCTIASNGAITCDHDALDNFVANEHLDWTSDLGATNIHAGNYINTTYLGGTNLTLDGTTFNVDDAFLKNSADDATAFGLTLGSASTTDSMYVGGDLFITGNNDYSDLIAGDIPDISATYSVIAGNASIATVGTIGTGTWQSTDIGVSYGGTGLSDPTDHAVLVGSGASALTALTVGTNGQILIGSTGADPVFANLTCGDNITCTIGAGTLEIDVDDAFLVNDAADTTSYGITMGSATTTDSLYVGGLVDITGTASTTDGNLLTGGDKVYAWRDPSATFASSTLSTFTGATTTLRLGVAVAAETWETLYCYTDNGTTTVAILDAGGNGMGYFECVREQSDNFPTANTLSTNNTFTAGEPRKWQIGNVQGSPTQVSITIKKTID